MSGINDYLISILTFFGIRSGFRINADLVPKKIKFKLRSQFDFMSEPSWNLKPWGFQAIVIENNKFTSVRFNFWGAIKSVISEINLENLPELVKDQLFQKYAGSTFQKICEVKEGSDCHYEIEIKKGFVLKHLRYDPSGTLENIRSSSMIH